MKKERNPIVVILTIILLSTFIIFPPVFRRVFPKQIEYNKDLPKLRIVNCNKIFSNELYQVKTNTKYKGTIVNSNTITYQKLEKLPDGYTESNPNPNSISVADEISYFKTIPKLNINESENRTIVTIERSTISDNSNDAKLAQYLNRNYTEQKKFYENLGYKCNVIES